MDSSDNVNMCVGTVLLQCGIEKDQSFLDDNLTISIFSILSPDSTTQPPPQLDA